MACHQEVQFGHLRLVQLLVPLAEPQVDLGAFPGLGYASGHDRVAGRVQSGSQGGADAVCGSHVGAEAGDGDLVAGQQAVVQNTCRRLCQVQAPLPCSSRHPAAR